MLVEKPTYTVREATVDGTVRYYASFMDGSGYPQETEITHEVYMALEECRRQEQRIIRSDERHMEQSLQAEAQLIERAAAPSAPLDEAVSLTLDLQTALPLLTETQRRRFLLYHEHGLRHEQIAAIEECSFQAVAKSIATAKEQMKKYFSAEG
jgi:RNA polymerase sigma-70 factor (ECF subfamily)